MHNKRNLLLVIIIIVFSNTLLSQIPTNGLVGYWTFSGNANDSSGNNLNGTVNGAVLTQDRFGNSSSAFNFDGIDDYILVNDDDLLSFPNNEFTFSFWVNPTLTQLPASPAFEEDFELNISYWTGDLSWSVQNDKWVRHFGATASAGTGPNGAQSGSKYRYYETTIPGNNHSVPYNGTMVSPDIDLTTSDTSELSFYFHAYGATMGTLDVRVGSSNLGYTSVYTLSGQQQTSSSAPWQNVTVDLSAFLGEVVHLVFEYTSQVGTNTYTGDIAIDNITVSQSTQYSYSPKIGIMGKREFSQPYVLDWEYNIFGTTDTTVGLVCWTNNGQNGVFGDGQSVLHSMNFTPGIWTNFIYSSDGDSLRYYKNGVKLGTIPKNTSGLNLSNQDGDLTFGLAGAWNQFNYLNGKLDDILIYDRALTQTEIDSISFVNQLLCNPVTGTDTRAECDSYTWIDGNTYTSSNNTATFNIANGAANGCDSIVTLDLTITSDTSYTNITACGSVVWNGTTYDSSGTYTGSSVSNNYSASLDGINDYVDVGNNSVLDIDNSVTIEAWINPSNLSNRHAIYSTRKNNNPGSFQLEIGTYIGVGTNYVAVTGLSTWVAITGSNVINNNGGWVHIAYTRDGVGNNHEIYINGIPQIINTNPYTFINNNSLKEIGRGTFATQNYDGQIDQVRIWDIALTQLEIQNYMNCSPTGSESGLVGYWNFEEGSGNTAFDLSPNGNDGAINGATYDNNVPSQSCALTNANGCDSTAILNLTINNSVSISNTVSICSGDSFTVGTSTYNTDGTYTDVLTKADGCDSTVTTILTTDPLGCTDASAFNYDPNAVCDDGSCIFPFSNLPDSISTCDSVQICVDSIAGSSYSWSTSNTSNSGNLAIGDTYQGGIVFWLDGNSGGLIAAPSDQSAETDWGCTGSDISGADGTAIGTGNQNTIDIEVGCSTTGTAPDICANLTLGGFSDWFLPSKDELNQMYLNIGQGSSLSNIGNFDNVPYWSSSEYNLHFAWVQSFLNGTPTYINKVVWTYNVRAIRAFSAPIIADTTNCIWVSNAGWNYITVTTANGITAIDSVYVSLNTSVSGSSSVSACNTYTWEGQTITSSGNLTHTYQSALGCDSLHTLSVTINNSTSNTTTITDCDSYAWSVNGTAYTQSGTYTDVSTNSSGCTHTETLVLTINNSTTNTTTITDCDSYAWSVNGTTYTQSGTYTDVSTNTSGCTHTEILVLIINNSTSLTNTVSICFGDSISVGSNTYSQTGTYTDVFNSVNGCDSIITTNLNVSQQIVVIISQLGLDIKANSTGASIPYVYEWNTGETSQTITPNQDGDYWVIVTDANGCLSNTSFFVVDWILTSIEHFNIDRLSIYPNPSRNIFNIEFTSLLRQNLEIRIINSIGEIVYLENLKNYTGEYNKAINLKEFSKALYFLEITTNDGIINKKLILQ